VRTNVDTKLLIISIKMQPENPRYKAYRCVFMPMTQALILCVFGESTAARHGS
jgi:hypothetical protein